jgi:small subunit ribosomal protein S6
LAKKANPGLNDYEILLILPPDLEEDSVGSTTDRVKTYVTGHGGEFKTLEPWGRRRLAFPIQRYHEGAYHVGRFALAPDQASELDRALRLNEQVLRHLIIRLDG